MNSEKIKKLLKNKSFIFWMSLIIGITVFIRYDNWKSADRPIDPARAEADNLGLTLDEFVERYNREVVELGFTSTIASSQARTLKIKKVKWDGKSTLAKLKVNDKIDIYVYLEPETRNIIKILVHPDYRIVESGYATDGRGARASFCMIAAVIAVDPEFVFRPEVFVRNNEIVRFGIPHSAINGINYNDAFDRKFGEGHIFSIQKDKEGLSYPGETPLPYKGNRHAIAQDLIFDRFTKLFDYYACSSGNGHLLTFYEGYNESGDKVLETGCNVRMYIEGDIQRIVVTGWDAGNPEARKDIFDAIGYACRAVSLHERHPGEALGIFNKIYDDCFDGGVKTKTDENHRTIYHYEESEETGEIFFEIYRI